MNKISEVSIASVATAGIIAGAGLYAKNRVEQNENIKAEEQKKMAFINKLKAENANLSVDSVQYAQRKNTYVLQAADYKSAHPQCENVQRLASLINKMSDEIEGNSIAVERYEWKKLHDIANKFCFLGGRYNLPDGLRKPEDLEDFIYIIRDNSKLIPQYKAIIAEYNAFRNLDVLLADFDVFIEDFNLYANEFWNIRPDVNNEESEYYEDGVCKTNTENNLYEDVMIDALLNKYLRAFRGYEKYGINVLDKNLYCKIIRQCEVIKQYNKIASGVVSYDKALQDVNRKMNENRAKIAEMQVRSR